ncbi:MAG: hypothetical protein K6G61_02575 [Solobacterium sp.]|nr:hypothetical protein [Solobacterium sp.]
MTKAEWIWTLRYILMRIKLGFLNLVMPPLSMLNASVKKDMKELFPDE